MLRVFAPDGAEVTFPGAIDPHTPVAQGWLRMSHRKLDPGLSTAVPARITPTTRSSHWRPARSTRPTWRSGRPAWSSPPDTGSRSPCAAGTGKSAHPGAPRLGSFKNELTGCGPFLHDDPADRPPWLTASTQTLWTGGTRAAFLLLPVIPADGSRGATGRAPARKVTAWR